jgi:hypothetical protein
MAKKKQDTDEGLKKVQSTRIINVVGTTLMFIVLGLVLYAVVFKGAQRPSAALTRQLDQRGTLGSSSSKSSSSPTTPAERKPCPTRTGDPWEYDTASHCYFDPSPGHGHWHVGLPPSQAERDRLMGGQIPTTTVPEQHSPALPPDG